MKYVVVTESGDRFGYVALGLSDAVEQYYATDGSPDEAPLAIGAYLRDNGWVGLQ